MNTMNIIRHLTTTISPQVLGDSPKAGERSLLKDFYAIFLARLSEKKTYNTLTNHGRLSAKKISWYKFVHNIDWHEEDGKTLLSAFATAHQLDETDIYDLLKLATPLTFFEVQALADHSSIPDYLQSVLHFNNNKFFTDYIPNWAISFFPTSLSNTIINIQNQDSSKAMANSSVASNASMDDNNQPSQHTNKEMPIPVLADAYSTPNITETNTDTTNDTQGGNAGFMKSIFPIIGLLIFAGLGWSLMRSCSSESPNPPVIETNKKITDSDNGDNSDVKNKSADIAIIKTEDGKQLKKPIEKQYPAQSTNTTKPLTENSDTNTKENGQNNNKADNKTNSKADTKHTNSSSANNNQPSKQTKLFVEVDNDGNLLKADIQVGTNALGFQINKAISNVYGEVALRNSKMTVNEDLNNEMLTMDKVNDLLTLVKDTPQGSVTIDGKSVSVNALRKKDRMNLIHQAQTILPSLRIIDGSTGRPLGVEEAKPKQPKPVKTTDSTDTKAPDTETTNTKTNGKEGNKTETKVETIASNAPKTKESDKQSTATDTETANVNGAHANSATAVVPALAPVRLDKPKAIMKDGKIDIQATVDNSNKASKQAIDRLNVYTNLQTVIDALNMQIINFKVNDSNIPAENKAILNKAASILKDRDVRIRITGHTDSDGNDDYNKRLSEDRSYRVKKYLMSQGVPSWKIKADGEGEDKPIATNSTDEGKFRNRRIEFSLISSAKEPTTK